MPPSSHQRRSKRDDATNQEDKGSSPSDVHALYIRKGFSSFAIHNVPPSGDGKQKKRYCRDANCGTPEPLV
jgi:hypothetical protein